MHTLRIHCTGRPGASLKPVTGACPAAAWDADDLTIAVWLDSGTMTAGVPDAFDITTIATLRLECRADVDTEAMLFDAKEVTTFAECTFTEFKDGTGEHAEFVMTASNMNVGAEVSSVWISITADLDDGTRHTFAAGELKIEHSGDSDASGAVADAVTPYTQLAFKTIAVSGQTNVVADTRDDTLTLVAGAGMEITTSGDTITFAATGGGGGGSGTVTSVSVMTANGVSGTVATATTTPAITLTLGAITPTSVNGLTITTTTGTLTIANGKTLAASNTLTLAGTDGSTLNIGTGGTLGEAAFIGKSAGGNGASDSGKALTFDSNGGINVTGEIVVTGGTGASSISGAALTDARLHTLPDSDGTIATQEWASAQFEPAGTYLVASSNLSDVTDVTTARGNLLAAGTGAANTFTAQNIFNLAPRVPTTDLASGTALTIGTYYYKAISADLGPLTFSGTPAEGSTILLHLEVSGTRTVTFPASYRNGEAISTITSLLFPPGLYLMGWQYRNSKWVLSDSLGALYNSTTSDPTANDDANDGYVAGKSIWINTSTGRTFICRDATATSAVWECINREKIAIGIACSDETTALTTGTAKATFRMPFAFTLTEVRATVTTAPTGSTLIVDINDGGTTIMSTNKLSIDISEKTSTTAATAAGITDSALADDAEITIDIDQVGSTIAGAGLKVWLIGYRSAA